MSEICQCEERARDLNYFAFLIIPPCTSINSPRNSLIWEMGASTLKAREKFQRQVCSTNVEISNRTMGKLHSGLSCEERRHACAPTIKFLLSYFIRETIYKFAYFKVFYRQLLRPFASSHEIILLALFCILN